jgi:hypothetical protein
VKPALKNFADLAEFLQIGRRDFDSLWGKLFTKGDAMPSAIGPPAGKALVFRFRGGPDDGNALRFDPPHAMRGAAHTLWATTRSGAVGQHFLWFAAGRGCSYKVIAKSDSHETIYVTCQHVESEVPLEPNQPQ